jgi:hypothetical protein
VQGLSVTANCASIGTTGTATTMPCSTAALADGSIATTNGTITRNDGGSWLTDGFAVGQLVTLDVAPQQAMVNISSSGVITRTDGGTWSGFAAGQLVTIDGARVGYVKAVSGGVLTLDSTRLLAGFAGFPNPGGLPQNHLVWVAEVGTVSAINKTTMTLTFLTTNFVQLVNAGTPTHNLQVANRVGNGAPFFVFALADPFQYAGNDVIDASLAFSKADPANLPSIGITAYGGPGNDTIIGSQAGDILAGGSGNDTVEGGRGQNQIYGDNGINVDVITRQLSIPYVNHSSYANADLLNAGQDLLFGNVPGSTANDPYQSQLVIAVTQNTTAHTGALSRPDGGTWAGFTPEATPLQFTSGQLTFSQPAGVPTAGTITRNDGLSWLAAGYAIGQLVTVARPRRTR